MRNNEPITKFTGETRWLSNFHEAPITYEGIEYQTTEAAYQAAKSSDIEVRKSIAALKTPGQAKQEGSKIERSADWFKRSIGVMTDIVWLKFEAHEDLREKLLATGNAHLEEGNNWDDKFWGTVDGVGENHLGKILMNIREELLQEQNEALFAS